MSFDDRIDVQLRPCTVAIDGERAFTLMPGQEAFVRLSRNGPRVVLIDKALRAAALGGVFRTSAVLE